MFSQSVVDTLGEHFYKGDEKIKKDMLMSFSIGTGGDAGFPLK